MPDGAFVPVIVNIGGNRLDRQLMIGGQPLDQLFAHTIGASINFCSITSGYDGGFFGTTALQEL